MNWAGAHVLVTGGSSGIGLATVRRVAARGARVSVLAVDNDDMDLLAANPPSGVNGFEAVAVDVRDRPALTAAIDAVVRSNGPVDVLVTSAGIGRPRYFDTEDDAEFENEMAVNYFGTLWAVRAVVPSMIERHRGAIVCISSAAALFGVFGYSAYTPTKYAVRGLCETLRTELAPHGIHVACVFPADVDTPLLAAEEPLKMPELRALSGKVRPIPPERVADAILAAVEKERHRVFSDKRTHALARVAEIAPSLGTRLTDWLVSRADRDRDM